MYRYIRTTSKKFKYRTLLEYRNAYKLAAYLKIFSYKFKDVDISKCISTPGMSCERVMMSGCSFDDSNTTYISTWPKQKSARDCQDDCKVTTIPKCHFWMYHAANEKCDLYERDKRNCIAVGGPASLSSSYCTGVKHSIIQHILCLFYVRQKRFKM